MNDTQVSVVIPFYSNVKWLEEAVDSVLEQTYKDYEIIVVNDGSKEDMDNFIEKYNKYIILINKENGGPASARNLGIESATGKYIAFLDSDDLWEANKLKIQVEYMEKTDAVFSHTAYSTFGGKSSFTSLPTLTSGDTYPKILAECVIATPAVMVKSDVIKNNKELRFNEDMRFGQDYYLWIQFALKYKIHAINETLCKVRLRGTNASKRARVQLKVKSMLWNYMKTDLKYKLDDIPKVIKGSYRFCYHGNRFVEKLSGYINYSKLLENISRVIYIIPYITLKCYIKIF